MYYSIYNIYIQFKLIYIKNERQKKKNPHDWGVNWGRNDAVGGFSAASFGFQGVLGEFGDEMTQQVGFLPCCLGTGVFRRSSGTKQ